MKKDIKLNVVISILVILVVSVATIVNLYSSTNALRTSLTNNYLESNYNYTKKLAEAIDYITSELKQSIVAMANLSSNEEFIKQSNLDILFESEKAHFNSVFITDKNGIIQLMSPMEIQAPGGNVIKEGTKIDTEIMKRALAEQKPFISEAYVTVNGTLLFLVTAPIFNEQGEHDGVMVGTVYLGNKNAINVALGNHGYKDGSYVYAVDKNGHLIYHPESDKIYEDVSHDEVVKKLALGQSGFETVTDEEGVEFFAGYSHIDNLDWGVVSLTPASTINEPLNNLLIRIIMQSATILLILLFIATFIVKQITKPLTKLAEYSERSMLNKEVSRHKEINIKSNIYEINQMYRQVKSHLMMLNKEVQIDGLTGLLNRKTFDSTIEEWMHRKEKFSLILLDIDNFKIVNDTYGHILGDEVIKLLASILEKISNNSEMISFRYGGEEFGLLIKNKDELESFQIAEQLRKKVSEEISPTGKTITISLGLTASNEQDLHPTTIIERADKALYQSKKGGRNRTTIYQESKVYHLKSL